ncbi:NADP-dependent malic enzyme [Hujiaoplasma nucleasis]|uniref:NADP-dependent malic enzyme n=1 Tax=Hujiaoplasma nucleasis TaxID=2725268 RepID=A0A7L6N4I1_9MOLU|nr:NADP-dependent malic enzyme [Hujiaoplasma nucleasis]QLY40402.1 NADP-dependent malic enzyme [Hujiaoplasma nucleasis]
MSDFKEKVLNLHKKNTGKLEILPNVKLTSIEDLSMAYTPGVAIPCLEIKNDKNKAYDYTMKGKTVAIITNGSAVLGLGNIGPVASLPVMEGKSALLHEFSGVQAYPLALDSQDPEILIQTIKLLSPNFSAIMLEDISAPNCVTIERRLQEELDIPVFHDDQHGTAIVVSAALINALKVVGKNMGDIKVLVSGLGAAGSAIIKLLNKLGVKHIYGYDLLGVLNKEKYNQYNYVIKELLDLNIVQSSQASSLKDLIKNTDVFIGVSAKDILKEDMIALMNPDPIIFAMANPDPEILPEVAIKAGAKIIGTGRSDYPNQINNVLVFPGLMKGVLSSKIKTITDQVKIVTAKAIASMVKEDELSVHHILPNIFDKNLVSTIEKAIKDQIKKG